MKSIKAYRRKNVKLLVPFDSDRGILCCRIYYYPRSDCCLPSPCRSETLTDDVGCSIVAKADSYRGRTGGRVDRFHHLFKKVTRLPCLFKAPRRTRLLCATPVIFSRQSSEIKPLTEPCLRYLRTRLLNNTLHIKTTIVVPKYEGWAMENAGVKV